MIELYSALRPSLSVPRHTTPQVMKTVKLLAGEIIDGTFMSRTALLDFLRKEVRTLSSPYRPPPSPPAF